MIISIFYMLAVRLGYQLHAVRHGKYAIAISDFFLVNSVPSFLDGFLQPRLSGELHFLQFIIQQAPHVFHCIQVGRIRRGRQAPDMFFLQIGSHQFRCVLWIAVHVEESIVSVKLFTSRKQRRGEYFFEQLSVHVFVKDVDL